MGPIYNANDPYENLISQIIAIERQPQFRIRSRRADQVVKNSVLDDFNSKLSSLNSSLETLVDVFTNPFGARSASVPEGAGFSVSATDEASFGPHSLEVLQLASADQRVSQQLTAEGSTLEDFFATAGAQAFTIEVASPTDSDPDNRVSINVTVDPTGSTDEEILEEIQTAITEAMDEAVADETISSTDRVSASVINESSGTARLSLQSATTGYDGRLSFSDSEGGLLSLLQLDRSGLANETVSTTTPATSASVMGNEVTVPLTVGLLNRSLEFELSGTSYAVNVPTGTYNTVEDLATALDGLSGLLDVEEVDGVLQASTSATGASQSLQLTGGTALADLGFEVMDDPVYGTDEVTTSTDSSGGQITALGTSETDSGLSSKFVLDGLTLYRSSNDVDDALDGLTLTLSEVGDAASFTIGADQETIVEEVNSFITQYNAALDFIRSKTKVDQDAGTRAVFAGDAGISGLRFGMRTDMIQTVASQAEGAPSQLSDLGIEIGDNGSLKLADKDTLIAAVASDPEAVQSFFSADDGVGTRLMDRLDAFLGADGILASRKEVGQDRLNRYDTQIERWDERLQVRENLLRSQYAQVQATIASVQGQQQSLFSFGF